MKEYLKPIYLHFTEIKQKRYNNFKNINCVKKRFI